MLIQLVPPNVGASLEEVPRLDVSFAGIHFALQGPPPLLARVKSTPRVLVLTDSVAVADAHPTVNVRCRLKARGPTECDDRSRVLGSRGVQWHWREDGGEAVTQHASARWERRGQVIAAEATVGPSPRAAEGLLLVLAAALLHRAGGAILHSASVELPDGIVAFIGPSGAGKSTACDHVEKTAQYSFDRLAVVPGEGTPGQRVWRAYPLPGGTPPASNPAEPGSHGLPLKAVLRVRQAAKGCWVEECSTSQAVALLRESAFLATPRPESEVELLALLEHLALDVPVANLHFCLGTSLGPTLSRWVTKKSTVRALALATGKEE